MDEHHKQRQAFRRSNASGTNLRSVAINDHVIPVEHFPARAFTYFSF